MLLSLTTATTIAASFVPQFFLTTRTLTTCLLWKSDFQSKHKAPLGLTTIIRMLFHFKRLHPELLLTPATDKRARCLRQPSRLRCQKKAGEWAGGVRDTQLVPLTWLCQTGGPHLACHCCRALVLPARLTFDGHFFSAATGHRWHLWARLDRNSIEGRCLHEWTWRQRERERRMKGWRDPSEDKRIRQQI